MMSVLVGLSALGTVVAALLREESIEVRKR